MLNQSDEFLIHLALLMGIPPNELEARLSAKWMLKIQDYVVKYGWPEDYSEITQARLLHTIQSFLGAKNLDYFSMLPPRMQTEKLKQSMDTTRKDQKKAQTIYALQCIKRLAEAPSPEEKKARTRGKKNG